MYPTSASKVFRQSPLDREVPLLRVAGLVIPRHNMLIGERYVRPGRNHQNGEMSLSIGLVAPF